jgi:hypothetical protein
MITLKHLSKLYFAAAFICLPLYSGYLPNSSVPALPAPRNIVTVSTAVGLITAVSQAMTGQTIMLADGDYYLTSSLRIMTSGITLRGASGDPEKAILHGTGFGSANINEELVKIEAANDTVAYLTIRDVRANGLKIQSGANNNLLVHNVYFIDICERSIKGPDAPVSYNGEIQYCYFEQVTPITSSIPNLNQNGDYIAGMDLMKIDGWKIHDNYFKNIRGMNGGGRAAIFLWNNCSNCIIERNTIVGCDRGIALGNAMNSSTQTHVINAICRNNFISSDKYDAGIEVAGVNGAFIVNNSIWKNDETGSRGIRFIADFSKIELSNNLLRGNLIFDNGQTGLTQSNNVIGSLTGYFANTATGDLHLTSAATLAMNKGIALTTVSNDWDGQSRASIPDIGADEYTVSTPDLYVSSTGMAPYMAQFNDAVIQNLKKVHSTWNPAWNKYRVAVLGNSITESAAFWQPLANPVTGISNAAAINAFKDSTFNRNSWLLGANCKGAAHGNQSGKTIRWVANQVPVMMSNDHPMIAAVEIGTNNVRNGWSSTTCDQTMDCFPDTIEYNLILDQLLKAGVIPIIATITPINDADPGWGKSYPSDQYLIPFNNKLKELATRRNLPLIDVYQWCNDHGGPAQLLSDWAHPKVGCGNDIDFGNCLNGGTQGGVENARHYLLIMAIYDIMRYIINDNNPPITKYTLTVTSGSGSGSYTAGTTVTIKANTAPTGKVFDQWTGSITGTVNKLSATTTITMPAANTSITATFKDITSAKDELNDEVSIYPNPVTNSLNIDCRQALRISIFDLNGRLMLEENHVASPLDVSGLIAGVYVIIIYTKNDVYRKSLIKQ